MESYHGRLISGHLFRRTARAQVRLIHKLQDTLLAYGPTEPERHAAQARLNNMGVELYNKHLYVQKTKRGPQRWGVYQATRDITSKS